MLEVLDSGCNGRKMSHLTRNKNEGLLDANIVAITESEGADKYEFVGPPAKMLSWQRIYSSMKRMDFIIGFFLKLSPLALLLSASTLWLYLKEIEAQFFFLPSLASSTGLMVIFWIGVFIFGSLLYFFLMPSAFLMASASVWGGKMGPLSRRKSGNSFCSKL